MILIVLGPHGLHLEAMMGEKAQMGKPRYACLSDSALVSKEPFHGNAICEHTTVVTGWRGA